ncbi:ATP-dependent RNA helicase TDRD9-like, partial [Ceratina calcarata]|uniref:ATP-dependent RNA helicase TDRD9-like n=1 Tax=Ceratina calcarata TaxID=156304 RepID=A0AAJ7RWN4_9HYME
MELRRSPLGTYYTCALCGLGYDSVTKASIFPDHDIELLFDVEINLDDLQYINLLRHWIDTAMQTNLSSESTDNMEEIII